MNTVQSPQAVPPNASLCAVPCELHLPWGTHRNALSAFRYLEINLWIDHIFTDLRWISRMDFRLTPDPRSWSNLREPTQALEGLHSALAELLLVGNFLLEDARYRRDTTRISLTTSQAKNRKEFREIKAIFDEQLEAIREVYKTFLEVDPRKLLRRGARCAQFERAEEYREWIKYVWEAATGETLSFE